jgi:hypothetical protein
MRRSSRRYGAVMSSLDRRREEGAEGRLSQDDPSRGARTMVPHANGNMTGVPRATYTRFLRWLQHLSNLGVLARGRDFVTFDTRARPWSGIEESVYVTAVALTDHEFGCARCAEPWVMRHANLARSWPPPAGWTPQTLRNEVLPLKIRQSKFRPSFLLCPKCADLLTSIFEALESENEVLTK